LLNSFTRFREASSFLHFNEKEGVLPSSLRVLPSFRRGEDGRTEGAGEKLSHKNNKDKILKT
jgi:hypothetical protein